MVSLGLANRVDHPGVAARFDARTDRHHHLLCDRCGTIFDIEDHHDLANLHLRAGRHRVRDYTVVFRGECIDCVELLSVRHALRLRRRA